MKLEGIETFSKVKHIIVDEMQDYTAAQYAVLSRLFPCNKTILGDANQNVNPYSSTTSQDIKDIFPDAEDVTLVKSYRSTWEITRFSQRISPHTEVEPVERHGGEPEIISFDKAGDEKRAITEMIGEFNRSEKSTLGILCKTQKQAGSLHKYIEKAGESANLVTPGSETLSAGVLITSAHLAKGLEFDQVIVPQVTQENYVTEVDRSMLYIACTRAMHELTITYSGEMSALLD
ncbi:MAG: 3'-5' exonuclease [Balneolaceae bacterium]